MLREKKESAGVAAERDEKHSRSMLRMLRLLLERRVDWDLWTRMKSRLRSSRAQPDSRLVWGHWAAENVVVVGGG